MITRRCILVVGSLLCLSAHAAADEARERDQNTLKEANVGLDGPSLLGFFRQRTPTEDQRKAIGDLIVKAGNDNFRVRRKAVDELEKFGLSAIGMLKQAKDKQDPEIARSCEFVLAKIEKVPTEIIAAAVARMLGWTKPDGALDVILAQLPTADDDQVADALRWALTQVALKDGKPEAKLVAALSDESSIRRAAAAESLLRVKVKELEPDIRKLLKDRDATVRYRTALAFVTVTRDKEVIPALIESFTEVPINHLWPAEEVLHHLAGDEAPRVSLVGDADARTKARAAWLDWWTKHKASINLAKLDEAPKTLGYTLILQMNNNGAEGEAKELAPDGIRERWRIRNLQLPIDAQFLPAQNRVLIAEYNSALVTERDTDGKIHRRWQVSEPIAVQRLPDGNTFIAHRNGFVEYNPKDERLVVHDRNMGDLVAGQKAKDGSYVILTRNGQCIRLNAKGQVLKTITAGRPYYFSSLELLPNNRVLMTQMTGAAEYDLTTGKQEWSTTAMRNPTSVFRLPNGHTLLCSSAMRKIVEVDQQGKSVKETLVKDGGIPWRVKRR